MYLLVPFILENFKEILRANPELWGCAIFGPKMDHLSWTKCFWYKPLLLLSSANWPFSLCKFLKKILPVDLELWGCAIFGPKMGPFPLLTMFFRKPVNEPCFFHSCLSICQKSKSDINLLVKYWQLKNTKISLAKSHFWL